GGPEKKRAVHPAGKGNSLDEYMTTEAGRQLFINRMDFFAERYGSDPVFFGWELWNEINAMADPENPVFYPWHYTMLTELKQRFPKNLVMQSLGSFDREHWRKAYQMLNAMEENEVAQVHRYLDLGAEMEICHQPMDIVTSSAIRELLSYNINKPVILAETGGVEPKHTGPIRYYNMDKDGILLHDALFAPFFSGSAGVGMNWHWNDYVDANNLWYHFGRFSSAIKGIDPVKEQFQPIHWETERLRVYSLKGQNTLLLWIRDKENTWRNEFENGISPQTIDSESIDIRGLISGRTVKKIEFYDPWTNHWSESHYRNVDIVLPSFSRSLVLKILIN
ncbi:MAG: cellulase family glycosylhydrolase, partial [Bacteroidota bacterium]